MKPAQRTPRTISDDAPSSQGRGGGREEIRAALLKPYLLRVRAEKGVEFENALVRKAGLPDAASRNETAWISAQAAHKALGAIEKLLGEGAVARRGSFGAHPEALGAYVRLVHRTSGPKEAFRVFCDQSSEATRIATYTFEDTGASSVKITYTPIESDDPPVHSRLLSQAREAELVAIPTLFGEPEATVEHTSTTADGGPQSVYVLTFSRPQRAWGLPLGALTGGLLATLPALALGPSLAALGSVVVGLGLGGMAGLLYDRGQATSRGQALERHRVNALERGLELRGDLASSSLPPGVLDGTVLGGKYKILHQIGSGGIGVIYSAEHLTLGSIVAIKVLRGAAARDAAEIARLRREAQVQVSIHHPNVVQTLDLDQMPDGSLYVVMELLRGRTLAEKMRNGPVPPAVAVPVFREVCFGLAACHAHGVVHRDMKPGNIFLCQDGTVKVLDFGMSKTESSETLTQEGFTLGTPEYMAPEQCTGGEVEPRTDLYAFGVLMYEALTGQLPIRASSRRELLDLHQRKVPATMAECRPDLDIPPELDAAVMKCLQKKPRDRPADARALEEMLALVPGIELPDHRRSSLPPLPPIDFLRFSFRADLVNMLSFLPTLRQLRSLGPLPLAFSVAALALGRGREANAYPHIVQKGETIAQIAEQAYGLLEMEKVLVSANGLDACGGVPIATGMRLEIPTVGHHRIAAGETWPSLAATLLGDENRQVVLAGANGSSPWMTPAEGSEIIVPYNLRVTIGQTDTLVTIAQRFLGAKEKAWVLDHYNRFGGNAPRRGDVVLVPITQLKLTPEAQARLAGAELDERLSAQGAAREAQRRVDAEFPPLLADVRAGRYVDAVTKGARMLSYGELSKPQLAAVHRQLLEAYVALGAEGLGSASCRAWRENDPSAVLDPVQLSPKLIAACDGTRR